MRSAWVGFCVVGVMVACSQAEPERKRFEEGGGGSGATISTGGDLGVGGASGGSTPVTVGAGGMPVTSASSSSTSSSSSGMPCNDPGPEPNDTLATATYLGSIDDCNGSGLTFQGVLDGDDVDWFTYDAADVSFCSVDPYRELVADSQVRLCKYLDCVSGTTQVTCPSGTSTSTASGLDGCCGTSPFTVDVNCTGTLSDDTTVYFRIDKPSGFSCVSYSGSFHY
ncbi:MAG: hypothetical protein R3B72_08330 [Polyangiaceae bacterium]